VEVIHENIRASLISVIRGLLPVMS
jgi:hypothetical protein